MRWVSGQNTSLVRQEAEVSAVAEPDIVHRAGILKGNSGDLAGKGENDMEVLCVEKVRPLLDQSPRQLTFGALREQKLLQAMRCSPQRRGSLKGSVGAASSKPI